MADVSRDQFMRILDAVNRGEIKLGTEDFTFGGGSSTGPTATEQQQANLDFLLKKAEEGRLTDANKEFLMGMTGTRYGSVQRDRLKAAQEAIAAESGGSPGARAGMLIGAAQGQRGGTGGAAVGAQPPRGSFGGPAGIDKGYYAGRPYVDYVQTDEGTVAVDQDGNVVSDGMGRQQQGMVSTQPVGEAIPVNVGGAPQMGVGGGGGNVSPTEASLNANFIAFLESLGLGSLVDLFTGGTGISAGGQYTSPLPAYDPSAAAQDRTKVGYDPIRGAYNVPAVMQPGSAAYQAGLFNYIYGPYTQPMAPTNPMEGITVPVITTPIQGM